MANLQIRIEDDLKAEAQRVAGDMGMDLTTAVKMFLRQMVTDRALPFKPTLDPFYSATNKRALAHSIGQLQSEPLIRKTLKDLEGHEE